LGLGERPPRLRFVVNSPFWGQVRVAKTPVCHRIAFWGPSEKPPRLRFFIGL
jgi:hypothetical protein